MTIEKRGVINEDTPNQGKCCGGGCKQEPGQQTKAAADAQEDHLSTRLSDAAADASKKK